jgi:hypothetical protein
MVRLSTDETPMDRGEFDGQKAIRVAGLLCRDPSFWDWLHEDTQIIEAKEEEATPWLRDFLGFRQGRNSRSTERQGIAWSNYTRTSTHGKENDSVLGASPEGALHPTKEGG